MRALLRRPGIDVVTKRVIEVEDLVIDLDKTSVHRKGVEIKLTPKEFFLIKYMVLNKNKVLSRAQILEKVWEIQFDLGTNVVDVYMNYLRKKIDKPFKKPLVQTIVGMGYMLKVEE
jgi:DNA-binding response OmpR family regulator